MSWSSLLDICADIDRWTPSHDDDDDRIRKSASQPIATAMDDLKVEVAFDNGAYYEVRDIRLAFVTRLNGHGPTGCGSPHQPIVVAPVRRRARLRLIGYDRGRRRVSLSPPPPHVNLPKRPCRRTLALIDFLTFFSHNRLFVLFFFFRIFHRSVVLRFVSDHPKTPISNPLFRFLLPFIRVWWILLNLS